MAAVDSAVWQTMYKMGITTDTPEPKQEPLLRQDSVRLLTTYDVSVRNLSLARTSTDSIIDTASGGSKSRKKEKRRKATKKGKAGLIMVKRFVVYAIFVISAAHLYLYQGAMESPTCVVVVIVVVVAAGVFPFSLDYSVVVVSYLERNFARIASDFGPWGGTQFRLFLGSWNAESG